MKKHTRKIISLVLTLVMVLSMTATVFAAEGDYTITVADTDDRTYAVYQIFKGDLYEGKLSNIVWGAQGTGAVGEKVDSTLIETLGEVNSQADYAEKFNVIKNYVDFSKGNSGTVNKNEALEVPAGYYLLADVTENVTGGEAYSLYVVSIVGDTTITPKAGKVTSQKKVDDANDSTGTENGTDWQDSADHDVNDAVPFQLKGTLPEDYANYSKFYYVFHDKQSAGLSFNKESVKVYVDDTLLTSGYSVVTENLGQDETFNVVFEDLKAIEEVTITASSVITVEYTSTLNDQAVIGSEGNPNVMYLEYSNNPNWESAWGNDNIDNDNDGEKDEEDEKEGPTGETPEDKVIVFTYRVVVNKVDEQGNALQGAGFTLYKKNAETEEYVAVGTELVGGEMTTFEWLRIDDGEYKLVETTTPAGYNTMADVEFTVSATHVIEAAEPTLTELAGGDMFTGEVSTATLTANVVNQSGTVLPETGGVGTTLLYVFGAVLVLGAGVVLVTKKRAE